MKSYLIPTLTVGILMGNLGQAQAVTISFDNFSTNFGNGTIANINGGTTATNFNGTVSTPPSNSLADGLFYRRERPAPAQPFAWVVKNGSNAITNGTATNYTVDGLNVTRSASIQTNGVIPTAISPSGTKVGLSSFLATQIVSDTATVRFDTGANSTSIAKVGYSFSPSGVDLMGINLPIGRRNDVLRLSSSSLSGIAGNLLLGVKVTDASNNTFTSTPTNINGLFNADLSFSSFSGIDFSRITAVEYTFNQTSADLDNNFVFIGATDSTPVPVPEPLSILGTIIAGGLGLAMKKKATV